VTTDPDRRALHAAIKEYEDLGQARQEIDVTPLEVRDRLLAIGMDLPVYTNELSAIHAILKRLNDAGEIRFVNKGGGKPAYIWNHELKTTAVKDKAGDNGEACPISSIRSPSGV
jgi:hypothetical protein